MNELNKNSINHLVKKYIDNSDSLEDFLPCLNMIKTDIELELSNRNRNCECLECGRVLFVGIMNRQNSKKCFMCDV